MFLVKKGNGRQSAQIGGMSCKHCLSSIPYADLIERYRRGEWRTPIFRDLILTDIVKRKPAVVLDIGCGSGFDGEPAISKFLADHSCRYIGIEPDESVAKPDFVTEMHRSIFESAAIQPASVDVAFAVMVLEHIKTPKLFMAAVSRVLKPGGVFWGFTVHSRHWFSKISQIMEWLSLKNVYLNQRFGPIGAGARYENYPTFYRLNREEDFRNCANDFSQSEIYALDRAGQAISYFPQFLKPLARFCDGVVCRMANPGALLIVRLGK